MLRIGIIGGGDLPLTQKILAGIFGSCEHTETEIICIDGAAIEQTDKFDILIVEDNYMKSIDKSYLTQKLRSRILCYMADKSRLIVNCDNKVGKIKLSGEIDVITYGFAGKACVTASSVSESYGSGMTVTVCVQRTLRTLGGKQVCEQEFNTTYHNMNGSDEEIRSLLASITAALLCDMKTEDMSVI